MNSFTIHSTPLSRVKIIKRHLIEDQRGYLVRLFCVEELVSAGWCKPIVQINQTRTKKQGAVRGMHYQIPPHMEMKLVSCISGVVWDVAVDLQSGSPTFLQWHGEELSADNRKAMLIPEGFAHGFQTLTPDAELLYLHSAAYMPTAEAGLNPKDPQLDIVWPLEISDLSAKDAGHSLLQSGFQGIRF
jgi:dTDP-4-dehydrorhamnose 3,5-epimerase